MDLLSLAAAFLLIVLLLLTLFMVVPLLIGLLKGAPYVPSKNDSVTRMLDLVHLKPGEKLVDLGSGDGRFLIAAAKAGATAVGYEVNPWLVLWSRYLIWRAGVAKQARVVWRDFRRDTFEDYDVIILYLLPATMALLEKKLQKEAKSTARIISNTFTFPHWKPIRKDIPLYLYKVKD